MMGLKSLTDADVECINLNFFHRNATDIWAGCECVCVCAREWAEQQQQQQQQNPIMHTNKIATKIHYKVRHRIMDGNLCRTIRLWYLPIHKLTLSSSRRKKKLQRINLVVIMEIVLICESVCFILPGKHKQAEKQRTKEETEDVQLHWQNNYWAKYMCSSRGSPRRDSEEITNMRLCHVAQTNPVTMSILRNTPWTPLFGSYRVVSMVAKNAMKRHFFDSFFSHLITDCKFYIKFHLKCRNHCIIFDQMKVLGSKML